MKKIGYLIIILIILTTQLFAQSTPPPPDYSVSVRQVGVSGPVKIKIEEGTFSSTYDYPVFIGFYEPVTVTLTAINYEYPDGAVNVFVRWEGDMTGYENPVTFDVYKPHVITAVYVHGDPLPTHEPTPLPTPLAGAGEVSIVPLKTIVETGSDFSVQIHANTGDQLLGAYSFDLQFDSTIMQLWNDNGVEPGPDGFITSVDTQYDSLVFISGMDGMGTGPGQDLHILTLNFYAIATGTSILHLIIHNLEDENSVPIGTPIAINGTVSTTCCPIPILGDVNDDEEINIIDALLIAQFYVGFSPPGNFKSNADVNCDKVIDIIDALLIAQYYVKLITEFCS